MSGLKNKGNDSKYASDETYQAYDEWKYFSTFCTREFFVEHRNKILDSVGEYHTKLFEEDGRGCYDICQMTKSVNIYNPIYFSTMSDTYIVLDLKFLSDKLNHFHYERPYHEIFLSG